MNQPQENPFNLTKANDYSDAQINEYWVDIPDGSGFLGMLKPASPMPTLILGGKGSGKTHLMRYCSYEIQRLRHQDVLTQSIRKEGYLGIYTRCEGLNANRFAGKGHGLDLWRTVFEYYMELFLADQLLAHLQDLLANITEFREKEPDFCRSVLKLFDEEHLTRANTLDALINSLRQLRREVDVAVNNCAITGKLKLRVRATRSRLIFGIPKALQLFKELRGVQVLYLIDELENFSQDQQKYVFTLVRERSGPSSLKIGSRLYGIKTYSTFSGDEEIKEGSEYEKLLLDEHLRSSPERYDKFARRLIASKIFEKDAQINPAALQHSRTDLDRMFERRKEDRFYETETRPLVEKYQGRPSPHFQKLLKKLVPPTHRSTGPRNPAAIATLLEKLRVPGLPLLEKLNIMLFYRAWSDGTDLARAATQISAMCRDFRDSPTTQTIYGRVYSHFAQDLVAQLLRENDVPQRYCGLDSFIHMSMGLPRLLLIILKHVYNWAIFHNERPFTGQPISFESQQRGVLQAASWFFDDAKSKGEEGVLLQDCLKRLAQLFREIRFSDKPVECSLCSFSINTARIAEKAKANIDLAEKYSLLIRVPRGQRDRNSMRVDAKFQINSILAPLWDLPIYRRGALPLDVELADAIFDPGSVPKFDKLMAVRIAGMNAPFNQKRAREKAAQADLFDLATADD